MFRAGKVLAVAGIASLATIAAWSGTGPTGGGLSIGAARAAADAQSAESYSFVLEETVHLHGESLTVHGHGEVSPDGPAVRLVLELVPGASLELRMVDGVTYVHLAGGVFDALRLAAGKTWVRFDAAAASPLGLPIARPDQGLGSFEGLTGALDEVGRDVVAGQSARHYRGTVDLAKLPGALGQAGGTVPFDFWLGDDDRVVKVQIALAGDTLGPQFRDASVDLTMTIAPVAGPVSVEAPPADEVVDLADVRGPTTIRS